jgi:hypothetical protein
MDLWYHAFDKSFARRTKSTNPLQQSPEETILPSSQGMHVAKFLSRARRVPIVYIFFMESAPLTKVSQQAHGAACW